MLNTESQLNFHPSEINCFSVSGSVLFREKIFLRVSPRFFCFMRYLTPKGYGNYGNWIFKLFSTDGGVMPLPGIKNIGFKWVSGGLKE